MPLVTTYRSRAVICGLRPYLHVDGRSPSALHDRRDPGTNRVVVLAHRGVPRLRSTRRMAARGVGGDRPRVDPGPRTGPRRRAPRVPPTAASRVARLRW